MIQRLRPGAFLAAVLFLLPGCTPAQDTLHALGLAHPKASFAKDGSVQTGFELFRGTRIYVSATIAGAPALALLDSGAGMTTLDAAFAREAGIKPDGKMAVSGAGGRGMAGVAHHLDVTVGALTLRDVTALVIDLHQVSQQIGKPLTLVLGREVFDAAVVEVDFSNRRLSLHDPSAFTPPPIATVVPLRLARGGVRSVPISVEGRAPILVGFDLGDGGTLTLDQSYWAPEHLLEGRRTTTAMAGGVGGLSEHRLGMLRSMDFAGIHFTDMPTWFTERDGLPQTIGARVISRFHLWIDYPHDRLLAVAGRDAATAPFRKDRSGLGVIFAADRLHVVFVAPNGPATALGLRVGDDIVAIDGVTIDHNFADSARVDWATQPAGTAMQLTLGDGRSLSLTLADYF